MDGHDHDHCIESALLQAEELCQQRGARLTPIRKRVLELVWQGHQAVKAYDLMERVSDNGAAAKPPTVYRALDFLIEQGLVHKIESLNAFVGCPHPQNMHFSQFLICDVCETVTEVSSGAVDRAIGDAASSVGFISDRQTIELHGCCAKCTQAQDQAC